jgi:hypothetical protein
MVLTIRQDEFQLMKLIVLDKDRDEALRLIKNFVARGLPEAIRQRP